MLTGNFQQGDMVSCTDAAGTLIAQGLINYASTETQLIQGKNSRDFNQILGFSDRPELIHRNNLVLYE